MTKDIEREAFESNIAISEMLRDTGVEFSIDKNEYFHSMYTTFVPEDIHFLNGAWWMFQVQNQKLEGCVVVPESEYNDLAQYKDLYKRAIVNSKKRKNQINWAHVAALGVGSGRAVELCKELKIDPYATDMNAMLEAARGGNENT